jgi:DNA-binding NtrC family response regulator
MATTYDPSISNELDNPVPPQRPTATSLGWSPVSAGDRTEAQATPSSIEESDIEPLRAARRNATTAFELKYLEKVLSRSKGSIARAAALSKVSRQMLQKLMRKHGVTMPR